MRERDITVPSGYCDPNYSQNKTTYYSMLVNFTVRSPLSINYSDCQNRTLQENSPFNCYINISTQGKSDSLNIWSNASLYNYNAAIANKSWFYPMNQQNSKNFTYTVNITVTPGKTEIGNWSINFTVQDLSSGENQTLQIFAFTNRTVNSVPSLQTVADQIIYANKTIYLVTLDDDLLVPDKRVYNETLTYASNVSWISLAGVSTSGNINTFKMVISYNNAPSGVSNVKINVTNLAGNFDQKVFSVQKLSDTAPQWNQTAYTFPYSEGDSIFLNLSSFSYDAEGDQINFSYSNDTSFPSFGVNATTGIINFTPSDVDVGQHIMTINASDGKLASSALFNFTIYNIDDNPYIENIPSQTASEDSSKDIVMYIEDQDLRIPQSQAMFYNESFNIDLTLQGANSSLFNFVLFERNYAPNKSRYVATFIPQKSDVGSYNVTVNVTDFWKFKLSDKFTLVINAINHPPVLMNMSNQTSAINHNFYLQINATDMEDGNSYSISNSNFTFSYKFLNGTNFLNSNNFNATRGVINLTFNSSQDGIYRLNISVNDSNNSQDSEDFWMFVYGMPNITFPDPSQRFTLQERECL